jgi:glycosyltransferase involved in cell wall biosynthesis
LKEKVRTLGLKNVEIVTDHLTNEELVSFLSYADIFMLPMNSYAIIDKGLPTKLLEYQAMGRPIVCISTGEAGRFIRESKSGLVSTTNDSQEIAQLIMTLANDEKLSNMLGKNGFNHIKDNLTLEKVGKRMLDIVKAIKSD